MSLRRIVEEYRLEHNGHKFWAPYAINEPGVPEGPYRGKGRPDEIKAELAKILRSYKDPLKNGEEVRYLMFRNNLGIDCSGFVFYVLDSYLQQASKQPLANYLFAAKAEILEAFNKESWQQKGALTAEEISSMPEYVPLAQVCERASKDPIQITNVARLCSEQASEKVDPQAVQPGDMVKVNGKYGDHIWLVIEVTKESVVTAESKFDPIGPGGIRVTEDDTSAFSAHFKNRPDDYICRLKT